MLLTGRAPRQRVSRCPTRVAHYLMRTYAYVAAGRDGLAIIDIERPEAPGAPAFYKPRRRAAAVHGGVQVEYKRKIVREADGRGSSGNLSKRRWDFAVITSA